MGVIVVAYTYAACCSGDNPVSNAMSSPKRVCVPLVARLLEGDNPVGNAMSSPNYTLICIVEAWS